MDVTIHEVSYRIGKLSAMDQLHIARYVAPLVAGIAPALNILQIEKLDDVGLAEIKKLFSDIQPFTEALAEMPEDRFESLVKKCLKACSREQGGRYHPVALGNGQIMYDDLQIGTTTQLIWYVIQENLFSFLPGPALNSEEEGKQPTAPAQLPRVGRR